MAVAITCGYGGYLLPLLAAHSSFCRIKFENLGIKTLLGSRWIDYWRVLMLVSLGTDVILLV